MRKMLSALLALALLATCCAAVADESLPAYMIPTVFSTIYNNAVEYVVNSGFDTSGMSASELQEVVDTFRITYTEQEGEIIYYNNPDWSVEASFYYEDGQTGVNSHASVLNLILNGFSDTARSVGTDALAVTLRTLDSSLDLNQLLTWLDSTHDVSDMLDIGGYKLMVITRDDFYQYVIMPATNAGGSGSASHYDANPAPAQDSSRDSGALLEINGFQLLLDEIELCNYSATDATLHFETTYVNNSPRRLNLYIEDVFINGVACSGCGIIGMEPHTSSSDDYFFLDPDDQQGVDALYNLGTATFTMVLKDGGTYDVLAEQTITMDLSRVDIKVAWPN